MRVPFPRHPESSVLQWDTQHLSPLPPTAPKSNNYTLNVSFSPEGQTEGTVSLDFRTYREIFAAPPTNEQATGRALARLREEGVVAVQTISVTIDEASG